jgi:hypothetical protein
MPARQRGRYSDRHREPSTITLESESQYQELGVHDALEASPLFANSNIAVTPKVTPFHSARDSGRKIVSNRPAERTKPSSLDSF